MPKKLLPPNIEIAINIVAAAILRMQENDSTNSGNEYKINRRLQPNFKNIPVPADDSPMWKKEYFKRGRGR